MEYKGQLKPSSSFNSADDDEFDYVFYSKDGRNEMWYVYQYFSILDYIKTVYTSYICEFLPYMKLMTFFTVHHLTALGIPDNRSLSTASMKRKHWVLFISCNSKPSVFR